MRIEKLSLKGLLRFTEPVTLDLRDVPPGLVALVGQNGEGKSTLLEAGPAAIYRHFLSRDGELYDYAGGNRDSYLDLELAVDGRGTYRARVNIDGLKRTTDAVLEAIQPDGSRVALNNDGKASTFDARVAELFPSKELLLASAFASQNKAGTFISKKPKERKDLFAELLGLQRYEAMSQTAKQAAAFVDQARARLVALRDLLASETSADVLASLETRAQELHRDGGAAELRRRELQSRIADLEAELATVQDQVAAYAVATSRVRTVETRLAERRADQTRVSTDRAGADRQLADELARVVKDRDAALQDIANRLAGNEQILEQATAIREAVAALRSIDRQIGEARGAVDQHQVAVRTAIEALRVTERTLEPVRQAKETLARVRGNAELLGKVPCGGSGTFAGCQFLTNARTAYEQIPDLEATVATEAERRAAVDARRADQQAEERALADAQATLTRLTAERATHEAKAKYAEPLAAADARVAELTRKRVETTEQASQREADARARYASRVAELDGRAGQLSAAVEDLEGELVQAQASLQAAAAGNQQAAVLQADLARERAAWDQTTATLATVEAGRQELQRRRDDVARKRERLAEAAARLTTLDTELLEWQLLAKAFSRDGLPVLEIDAAGPTISATTNELLEIAFGPRFTLELVTQQAKADGKGMKDGFSVEVTDNQRGAEPRDIADLSGGEQVIVAEALMASIAIYVNTRSSMPIRTLWRDETTGALDPENAVRYVQMLRKVQALGGYHHVIFISHNRDVAVMADAQIHVAGGAAAIAYPPFQVAA